MSDYSTTFMIRLDHAILHIDNDEQILQGLKKTISGLGYPFNPASGEHTHGFAASNLWIGNSYIKFTCLKTETGSGWEERWIEEYNNGHRGICALVVATRELDSVKASLTENGIEIYETKKKAGKDIIGLFTDLLGLKKTLPWKAFFTPAIPGTKMELGFIEYDAASLEELRAAMIPNSAENGIKGIHRAKIYLPEWEEGLNYLGKIFPQLQESKAQYRVRLRDTELFFFRSEPGEFSVKLETRCENKEFVGGKFEVENLSVKTTG